MAIVIKRTLFASVYSGEMRPRTNLVLQFSLRLQSQLLKRAGLHQLLGRVYLSVALNFVIQRLKHLIRTCSDLAGHLIINVFMDFAGANFIRIPHLNHSLCVESLLQ